MSDDGVLADQAGCFMLGGMVGVNRLGFGALAVAGIGLSQEEFDAIGGVSAGV